MYSQTCVWYTLTNPLSNGIHAYTYTSDWYNRHVCLTPIICILQTCRHRVHTEPYNAREHTTHIFAQIDTLYITEVCQIHMLHVYLDEIRRKQKRQGPAWISILSSHRHIDTVGCGNRLCVILDGAHPLCSSQWLHWILWNTYAYVIRCLLIAFYDQLGQEHRSQLCTNMLFLYTEYKIPFYWASLWRNNNNFDLF